VAQCSDRRACPAIDRRAPISFLRLGEVARLGESASLSSKEELTMHASIPISVLAYALLLGCGSVTQVGLSNAPVLGGATPDPRVHDVIANGRDACERSAFPPGEVLRGQIPPCVSGEREPRILTFVPMAPASAPISPAYSLTVCRGDAPAVTRDELALAAIRLSSRDGVACRDLW
jgi:hypothetical protein